VRFVVSRVVHQHVLDAGAIQSELAYLLFGSRERPFAVHHIAGSPGFDEVLNVDLAGDLPSNAELATGLEVHVAGASDARTSRMGLESWPKSVQAGRRTFTLKSKSVLSCLEGPEFSDACK